jgi:hypothetical protein
MLTWLKHIQGVRIRQRLTMAKGFGMDRRLKLASDSEQRAYMRAVKLMVQAGGGGYEADDSHDTTCVRNEALGAFDTSSSDQPVYQRAVRLEI